MKDIWNENLFVKKSSKKRIKTVSAIFLIVMCIIALAVLYVSNLNFREWVDTHILQKELERNDAAVIDINSNANVEICAYDKYIGILSKNKFSIYLKFFIFTGGKNK